MESIKDIAQFGLGGLGLFLMWRLVNNHADTIQTNVLAITYQLRQVLEELKEMKNLLKKK